LAHGKILSTKSKKLAAAIRFSSFCTQDANETSHVEIELDIRLKMACLLVQHCYHGSIVTGLSKNRRECCQELMELALITEEYLCPSLLAECEMRLLSARPNTCFCWCCCESIVKSSETAHEDDELNLFSEFVECSYSISSSAILVNIDTAIDLVAATQEISHWQGRKINIINNHDCGVKGEKNKIKSGQTPPMLSMAPFLLVKLAALKTIILNFIKCLSSDSYVEYLNAILSEDENLRNKPLKTATNDVALAMLYNCLEEYMTHANSTNVY